ncbi:hypothetical protein [Streptomyces sp. NRRL F-5135]|uniref:hypothetical protein n=1 Tax=Streptomyces sp. NRRL F-5135 TaxID=1463858 RepID=UPI0004CA1E72|nr:hypothetical protein [Streptomyces sp. NRRL F-5135]
MTALVPRPSVDRSTDHPELNIRATKACWSQNSDGVWTWYPQPDGVQYAVDPLADGMLHPFGAFHEAGHAVIALSQGIGVDGVHLLPAEENVFHTVVSGTIPRESGYLTMLAAGERASDRWLREIGAWTPERAWTAERCAEGDREEAVDYAARCDVPFDLTAHPWGGWTQVCSWADGSLNYHWHRVCAVAAALLDGTSLDAKDVARISGLDNPSA